MHVLERDPVLATDRACHQPITAVPDDRARSPVSAVAADEAASGRSGADLGVDDGEETLTLYSEGFVVMAHSRCGGPGRLGIWDCRRPKGQDGCVTRIDLTALVKELYLELWEGRGLGAGETDEEGGSSREGTAGRRFLSD